MRRVVRPAVWRLDPNLVMLLILAELLAAAEGRGEAPRTLGEARRARRSAPARRKPQLVRGTLSGRRPRG